MSIISFSLYAASVTH